MSELERLIDEHELAKRLGCSVATIRRMRAREDGRTGPPVTRIGCLVRYRPSDVVEWLDTQREAA